ncbi:MAG: hypothetical protein H5T83_13610 [Actinotalea sp.]|nr:hypothetical protein [Actinotalea sp.]
MRWFSGSPRTASAGAVDVPDALPVLSAGRHRTPRTGACFMEWASLLAGERFSDHPTCTHPLLAHLARMVNDATTERGRAALAPLVPSVVGLTGEDPRTAYDVAVAAALVALPVVREEDRLPLAAGVLTCERLRALRTDDGAGTVGRRRRRGTRATPTSDADGDPLADVRPATRAVLVEVPDATTWAVSFTADLVSLHGLADPAAALAEHAVVAVLRQRRADATDGPDTDALLARMLRDAIAAAGSPEPDRPLPGASPRRGETPHRHPEHALPTT